MLKRLLFEEVDKTESLTPKFKENFIPIVFSTDNNYALYLGVTLQSLIVNSDKSTNYDIIILEENLHEAIKNRYMDLIRNYSNISIRFYNMTSFIKDYACEKLFVKTLTVAAYYRLFIAEIMINYEKVIYFDSDIVIKTDLKDLYGHDITNFYAGAVKDIGAVYLISHVDFIDYLKEVLDIDDKCYYFNSGVMLFNLTKIRNDNLQEKFINVAQKNNKYYHDQNVLNSVLYKNILYLDTSYNSKAYEFTTLYNAFKDKFVVENYMNSSKILHFAGDTKPWKSLGGGRHVWEWWQYARQTSFYEEILFKIISQHGLLLRDELNQKHITLQNSLDQQKELINQLTLKQEFSFMTYYRYKILQKLTWGKTRRKYKEKYKKLKEIKCSLYR